MAPTVPKPAADDEILGLPKWAWAAIAGGVITAGLALYIFSGDDGGETKKKKPKSSGLGKKKAEKGKPSSVSSTPTKSKQKEVKVEDVPEEQNIEEVSSLVRNKVLKKLTLDFLRSKILWKRL